MALPGSEVKTYSRRNTSSHALNSLLMTNLVKRKQSQRGRKRKGRVLIKDLPLADENHHLLDDSFIPRVKTDDPFDLVCRLTDNNFEKVQVKSSDSLSMSKRLSTSNIESVKKRLRNSKRNTSSNMDDTKKLLNSTDTAHLHIEKVVSNYQPQVSYYSSLSSLSCSQIDSSKLPHNSTVNISYDHIFNQALDGSSTNKLLVASTPLISSTPIRTADLLKETYHEICSWNVYPNITPKDFETTPVRNVTKNKSNRTFKSTSNSLGKNNLKATVQLICSNDPLQGDDLKLRAKPKVLLCDMMDVIGISNTVTCPPKLKGFSKEDQSFSHLRVQLFNKIENGCVSSIRYHDRIQKKNNLRINILKKTFRISSRADGINRLSKSDTSLEESRVRKKISFRLLSSQVLDNSLHEEDDSFSLHDHNYSLPEYKVHSINSKRNLLHNLLDKTAEISNSEIYNIDDDISSEEGEISLEEAGLPNNSNDFERTVDVNLDNDLLNSLTERSCREGSDRICNKECETGSEEEIENGKIVDGSNLSAECNTVSKALFNDDMENLNREELPSFIEKDFNKFEATHLNNIMQSTLNDKNINDESWISNYSFEPSLCEKEHSEVDKDDGSDLIDCTPSSVYEDHSYVAKIGVDQSNYPTLHYYSSQDEDNNVIENSYNQEDFMHNLERDDSADDLQVVDTSSNVSCIETSIALCEKNIKKYKQNMNIGIVTKSNEVSLLETTLALCAESINKLEHSKNMNESVFTPQLSGSDSESYNHSITLAVLNTKHTHKSEEIIDESVLALKDVTGNANSCNIISNLDDSTATCTCNVSKSSENNESVLEQPNLINYSSMENERIAINTSNASDSIFSDASSEAEIVVTDDIDPSIIQRTYDEEDIMHSSVISVSSESDYESSEESDEDQNTVSNKSLKTTNHQPSCFYTPSSNDEDSIESLRNSEVSETINPPKEDVIEILSSDDEEDTSTTRDEIIASLNKIEELITENSNLALTTSESPPSKPKKSLTLKSGKSWRRTLINQRRSLLSEDCTSTPNNSCICACSKCQNKDLRSSHMSIYNRRLSVRVIPESPIYKIRGKSNLTVLESYASNNAVDQLDCTSKVVQSLDYREDIGEPLINVKANNALIHDSLHYRSPPPVTAREIVLRRCGQVEPKSFSECYSDLTLRNCFKIGEGVYGEVFLFRNAGNLGSVMKVIPIEGNQMVNGERQKKFEEILSEIIIAGELSNLRTDTNNNTCSFSEVQNIRCVHGCYPKRLLELWELYDEMHGSENDSPDMFKDDQLYIVLELANGGKDMEAFVFNNAVQAFSLFKQTACALAIAEASLQFEHRDLHWGNLLISQTEKDKTLSYRLNGTDFTIPTCGIQVSIIDFTLSRITFDGVCIFNDLSLDPDLFTASGDYQFEVYKLMQKQNGNEWQHFEPYTNVLWLHYMLDKIIHLLHYKYSKTRIHRETIKQLKAMKDRILSFDSAVNFVNDEFLS